MEEFSAVNGGASDPSGDLNPAIVPFERVLLLTPAVFFCIICRELMELSLEVPTLLQQLFVQLLSTEFEYACVGNTTADKVTP